MSTIYISLIFVPEKKTHEEPLRGRSLQSLICFQRPLNMDRVEQYTNAMLLASSKCSSSTYSSSFFLLYVLGKNNLSSPWKEHCYRHFFQWWSLDGFVLPMTKKSCGWGCLKLVTFFEYNRPSFPIVSYIVASQIQDLGIFD